MSKKNIKPSTINPIEKEKLINFSSDIAASCFNFPLKESINFYNSFKMCKEMFPKYTYVQTFKIC